MKEKNYKYPTFFPPYGSYWFDLKELIEKQNIIMKRIELGGNNAIHKITYDDC